MPLGRRRSDQVLAPERVVRDARLVTIRRAIPNVVSGDVDASRDFYKGLLGFQVVMDEEGFLMFASPSSRAAQVTAVVRSGPRAGPWHPPRAHVGRSR